MKNKPDDLSKADGFKSISAGGTRFWGRSQKLGAAAVIMAASIFLSRFMGLIRDKMISLLFGATQESDIYFAAFVIPDFLNYLIAGGYFSITLIPLLAACFEKDPEEGWNFFSAVLAWIGLLITLLTVTCMIFAHELARFAAPGLSPQALDRLALFLQIILPAQICFLLGSCFTAVLYLRRQFLVPALTPLVYNAFIIIGGVLLRARGMEGFCWGVLAGALIGNLFLPLVAVRWGGGLNLRFKFTHPRLKSFILLALPLMIGQSIVVLDEQLVRIFGSLAAVGAISWLNYARRIMLVPVGVVAQAAGVASYPFLADLAAKGDVSRFNATLNEAMRNVLTLLLPLSIWLAVVSEPTIRLIFQGGRFGPLDTRETACLLMIMLAAVFCWGIQQILGRGYYARQDTFTPAAIGTLTTAASIPIFLILTHYLGVRGVAAASALSIGIYTAVLVFWWHRKFGGEAFAGLVPSFFKLAAQSAIAALPGAAIVYWSPLDPVAYPYGSALAVIVVSGFVFASVFFPLSSALTPDLMIPYLRRLGPMGKLFIR